MDAHGVGDQIPSPRGYALSGKVMLISTVVLFGAVFLLFGLHLYLRSRFLLLRQRHRRIRRRLVFALDGAGGALAAPSSRGLDPSVVKSLPLLIFSGSEEGAVDCAVCLCDFEEGEKTRVLPRCAHRFHIDCIDMWFHSHSSCPLCRSTVEAHPVMPPAPSPPEPDRPSSADPCPGGWRGASMGSPGFASREIRIDVPERGLEDELGLGLKSPWSGMMLLTKLLIRDSSFFRSGGTTEESSELENGQGPASHPPRPPPSSEQ